MAPKKGITNNPRGRPPKGRALSEILEKAGTRTVEVTSEDGTVRRVAGKQLVARMAWELVATGKATLPDGGELKADLKEWLEATKWIYAQIDGPPKQSLEVAGEGGGPMLIRVVYDDDGA